VPCIITALDIADSGDEFISPLMPKGFEVYVVHSNETLLKIIRSHPPDLMIVDYDNPEYNKSAGLEELRSMPEMRTCRIVLFSTESGLDFVKATMRFGVVGYLPKPISMEEIEERLGQIISSSTGGGKRREFVRVKPAALETLDFELFLGSESASIGGEIMDISIGGVACRLRNAKRAAEIENGRMYPRMEIALSRDQRIQVGVIPVIARGDTVAFRITQLNEESLRLLCKYIHKRLIEDEEDNSPNRDKLMKVL
jgi:CheY-like chemotaxis protein